MHFGETDWEIWRSALKMEAARSPETLIPTYQSVRRYIPVYRNVQESAAVFINQPFWNYFQRDAFVPHVLEFTCCD
jgi:hypothetical protein